jgi:secondary thiamine-phosphate synthase enzyme
MIIKVPTAHKRQAIDISEQVEAQLPAGAAGVVVVTVLHTTAAITTANLDPGTDLDLMDALEDLIKQRQWRHPHNPSHVRDHLLASVIGTSVTLPFREGQVALGVWQGLMLIELDGPRTRDIDITILRS